MGQSDDVVEDSLFTKHQDLCSRLNIDASAATESWRSYENIRQHYTLEGDQLHWIGCALYVACRKTTAPTVGKSGTNVQGNCVSLTQLLSLYNLPLIEFFAKSKAWADMCNMPKDFGARIDLLHKNFSVSSVIFQKYKPIFRDIFKYSIEDFINPPKSRRHRVVPCTPSRLFEFCWSLFICIKSRISTISDDLVNSYHLLLVCCDLMYSNALLANRKDLLNPDFSGLPENFNDDDFTPPLKANCIVSLLCERHNAISVEAIGIKEYFLKRFMNKLFSEKIIKGNASNFSGILEGTNFEGNLKAINKAYQRHVLSIGDLDERIFLDPDSNNSIGSSPSKIANQSDLHEQFQSKKEQLGGMHHLAFPTPLTGRKYLKTKDSTNNVPSLHPTQSVIRLNTLLVGCQTVPSENLQKIFRNSSSDMQTDIESKVEEFGQMFYNQYVPEAARNSEETENSGFDIGKKRQQSAQTLFYKILELVLTDEISKKPDVDVSVLLKNVNFIQCLFACSCEIVLYSYQNREKTFPWVLKALNLEAYNFFKVIEITIKVCVDQLTRDMVKYLNRIEETILESLAWESKSPLWDAIKSCEGVPSYEDVALPGTFETVVPSTPGQPALRRIALDGGANHDVTQSPNFASERFHTPAQSVLRAGNSNSRPSTDRTNGLVSSPSATRPRRTGSLALFFRKFYHMTITRMQTLCNELQITEVELKRKIWTIFECSIMKRTHLMKDRHLDQILVCAVYVICKLCKIQKNTFAEIMQCYRKQPQAASHIYRSVLISERSSNSESATENGESENSTNEPPPTPTGMAATSHFFGTEERGDLIKFYNTVYVSEVKIFVEQFGLSRGGSIMNLILSPLPQNRPASKVPAVRRVTDSVMTRILDPKEIVASPAPQLQYCFDRSPTEDLKTINNMVTAIDVKKGVGKRLLSDETEISTPEVSSESKLKKMSTNTATTFIAKKLENIIDDRRVQNH